MRQSILCHLPLLPAFPPLSRMSSRSSLYCSQSFDGIRGYDLPIPAYVLYPIYVLVIGEFATVSTCINQACAHSVWRGVRLWLWPAAVGRYQGHSKVGLCVVIKLHMTTQPGPVKLIFQCYSNGSDLWGISVCVCVYLFERSEFLMGTLQKKSCVFVCACVCVYPF